MAPKKKRRSWTITAVGFKDGDRSHFHCLAALEGAGVTTTSAFGV
jgi:hypothetical protein